MKIASHYASLTEQKKTQKIVCLYAFFISSKPLLALENKTRDVHVQI